MSRFGGRVVLGVVVVLALAVGMVLGRLTRDEPAAGQGVERPTADEVAQAMVAPVCPDTFRDVHDVAYRPVDDADPVLDGSLSSLRRGRAYCVTSAFREQPRGWRTTSYTVDLTGGPGNYDERYTTSDRRGTEEVLNFPFTTRVHGRCARVDAQVVMTDREGRDHLYHARLPLGPGCGGRGNIGG